MKFIIFSTVAILLLPGCNRGINNTIKISGAAREPLIISPTWRINIPITGKPSILFLRKLIYPSPPIILVQLFRE